MVIHWKRALAHGATAASLLLVFYWVPTWRPQWEYAPVFRVVGALCKSCNPIPDEAVVALLDDGRSMWHTCLLVEGKDPSPTLLARAKMVDKTVVPKSQCTHSYETGLHTPSGKQAMAVSIKDWHRISLNKATVSISEAPGFVLGGSGWTCEFHRSGESWTVGDCRMDWIS